MIFTKKGLTLDVIEDTVFKVVKMAKDDIALNGDDNVVNATIGSLFDEDNNIVAFNCVFDAYNRIENGKKAAYAQSFVGNDDYLKCVNKMVTLNADFKLPHKSVATTGGTGAISLAMLSMLEKDDVLIAPSIAWGSYKLMANQFNLDYRTYNLMHDNQFDLASFKTTILETALTKDKIFVIINDPCHNPTGLSMGKEMWNEIIEFLNSLSKNLKIIILNDTAYIDYSFDLQDSRDYMAAINKANENILYLNAFSLSKAFTFYGMRCGALFVANKHIETVNNVVIVLEKMCRSIWSNVNNAAMECFADVINNHYDQYNNEKNQYIELLKKRSDLFIKQANECGLKYYHYDEGFFITLSMTNQIRDIIHQLLIENHIYTVKVNEGIRIAVCSTPLNKIDGLAYRIMQIINDNNVY